MQERIKEILGVVGAILWRGFGILLFVIGGSGLMGAAVAGSWTEGIVIAWGTLMVGIIGAVGYAIATTGRATKETVAEAANDAVKKYQEQQNKSDAPDPFETAK